MSPALELAVQDLAGYRVAQEVGAVRVELTQALALGGLTPSAGTLQSVLQAVADGGPEVHVLIRPRAGDFCYTAEEIAVMVEDVRHARRQGAHGVVVGCQNPTGELNREGLQRLVDAAAGASVCLHRVIDATPDPVASLHVARELGVRRVLTSGGASAAIDGVDVLRRLVDEAAGAVEVMAGSGIDAGNVVEIAETGVDAVHFSAKRTVLSGTGVRMGSAADETGGYEVTDLDRALAVVSALRSRATAVV